MKEEELLMKISQSLKELCKKQKIGVINNFTIIINLQISVSTEKLLKKLLIDLPQNVTKDTKIFIKKLDLEILSAVIYKVDGEKQNTI